LKVPEEKTPQVWKFIIVNGQVVIYGERCSNAHGHIPMIFGQPLEDGLGYQTKSYATNVLDMQDIASTLWNGFIASKRRLVGDRVLYDPLRIRKEDINSTNPAAKIPVRPAAYGKNIQEAVFPFPYRDEQTASMLIGAEQVMKLADRVNSQNAAQQGQFVKGNKTSGEFFETMGRGNIHNQTMAIMTENQVFVPVKEVIKLNILQYQEAATLYNPQKKQTVQVKPEELRKQAVHFMMSDGANPKDKVLNTDEFQTALQVIGSSPQFAAGFNLPPMVSYLFKMRGIDLSSFEKSPLQLEWEKMLAVWQNMAMEAVKKGLAAPPQPQMPPELIQEMQQRQMQPSNTGAALTSTQGS
jgi:hypothetical protein